MEYNIDKSEVRRYLGIPKETDDITEGLIDECIRELTAAVRPKSVLRTFAITRDNNRLHLDECSITLTGNTADERLSGCTSCALLGATLGIEADNLIRTAQSSNMAKAVIFDACATDLIEKVCDRAQSELAEQAAEAGLLITERFSPGYGDLPLELQKDICSVLDLGRKIGVYLTNELLLLPTKSVTAFIGIGSAAAKGQRGCAYCTMKGSCRFCNRKNA